MIIVVNDANILIDLVQLDLLSNFLPPHSEPPKLSRRKLYGPVKALFNACYRKINGLDYDKDLEAEKELLNVNNRLDDMKEQRSVDITTDCLDALYDVGDWWSDYGDCIWSTSWDSGFPGASGGHWIHHIHGAYISWGSDVDVEGPFEDGDVIDVFGTTILLKNGEAIEEEYDESE